MKVSTLRNEQTIRWNYLNETKRFNEINLIFVYKIINDFSKSFLCKHCTANMFPIHVLIHFNVPSLNLEKLLEVI